MALDIRASFVVFGVAVVPDKEAELCTEGSGC